jgi:6-phosphofructokinase 1
MEPPAGSANTLVVAQSGGPTAVVNASLAGALERARTHRQVQRALGARFGAEGILAEDFVDLTPLKEREIDVLVGTPGAALGSSRYRPSDAEIRRAAARLAALGVGWVLMIGGNDSAETLHRLHGAAVAAGLPLRAVGIPKTTDNDLLGMDHCPGYGSAARSIAVAALETGLDTSAMRRSDPVKILEVMGRNAGWLAASAALAREAPEDAPHLIFLPERPRSLDRMLEEIRGAYERRGWVVIVLSENQRDDQGRPLAGETPVYTDPHGHPYHESPGVHLARVVQGQLGLRARAERPGSLQRTAIATMSTTDVDEARQAGAAAWDLAAAGESDVMVRIERAPGEDYAVRFGTIPLAEVAHQERHLPDAFIAASGTDVTDAFLAYARPLIGGPLPPAARLLR